MATSEEILRVRLLDAKKAETELRSVRRELERTTGKTEEHTRASQHSVSVHERAHNTLGKIGNVLAYGGGLIGIGAAAYGIKDLTEGGIKAQEQQLLLQNALRQTGQAGSKHIGELQGAITKTTGRGGFGALEETEGLASFVRLTKSSTDAVKLNREAIMLARGVHESYGTAVMQVSRIQTGQVGRLQRYLGIIQPVKYYENQLSAEQKKRFPEKVKEAQLLDKEATAREANRRVLERYGGAVTSYNKSTAGAISNANNAFKNATEQLGEKLLPAETAVAKEFSKLIEEISDGKGPWKQAGKDIEGVWSALEKVYKFLEGHKNIAKILGYGAAVGVVATAPIVEKALTGGGGEAGEAGLLAKLGLERAGLAGGVVVGGYVVGKTLSGGNPYGSSGHEFGEASINHALARKEAEEERHGGTRGQQIEHELRAEEAKTDIHIDGQKIGEVMIHNPVIRRALTEASTKHVQQRKARE